MLGVSLGVDRFRSASVAPTIHSGVARVRVRQGEQAEPLIDLDTILSRPQ